MKVNNWLDLIFHRYLPLLNQRLRIAQEIGKIKKQLEMKIYDRTREKEVLEGLRLSLKPTNKRFLKERDLERIFATIIKVCRQSER